MTLEGFPRSEELKGKKKKKAYLQPWTSRKTSHSRNTNGTLEFSRKSKESHCNCNYNSRYSTWRMVKLGRLQSHKTDRHSPLRPRKSRWTCSSPRVQVCPHVLIHLVFPKIGNTQNRFQKSHLLVLGQSPQNSVCFAHQGAARTGSASLSLQPCWPLKQEVPQ